MKGPARHGCGWMLSARGGDARTALVTASSAPELKYPGVVASEIKVISLAEHRSVKLE